MKWSKDFGWFRPWKVIRAALAPDYKFYDADQMQLVDDEGNIDWCCLQDCAQDEYRIMLDDEYVKAGLIDVDKPCREGRGMFIASHQSNLFIESAAPAAHAGLWWHAPSRTPDFEKSPVAWNKTFNRSMSQNERENITRHIETWRVMFPGDTRVDDFESDFVLDMLTRRRSLRRDDQTGTMEVWFDK